MEAAITFKKIISFTHDSAARLRALLPPLWRQLTIGADNIIMPKKSLCVSIEKAAFSVAYGTRFLTEIKINALRRYPIKEERYPRPEELVPAVPLAINELKAAKADVTLSIPKKWVVFKKAEFPITVKKELRGVMSYEMDKLTPFSAEGALYDFRILKEDDKNITVLLVAVRAGLVNKYLNLLGENNIHVSRLSVNLSCIGSLSRYIGKKRDSIFIEIDANEYEGALFSDGLIAEVFTGSNDNLNAEAVLKEIAAFTESAAREGRIPNITISLSNIAASFGEALRQKTDLPVQIFDEAQRIGAIDKTDIKLRSPQAQNYLPHASVGGVVEELWQKANGFNLLKKGVWETQKTPLLLTLIFLIIIAALLVIYMIMPAKIEEERLAKIESEIALRKDDIRKHESLSRDIEDIQKEISDMRSFKESRPEALNIIREFAAVLPKNAWLSRMRISENMVEVEGYAGSATGLLSVIEASGYFRNVELASPAVKDTKKGVDRFSIRMEIEGAIKTKTATKELEEGIEDEGL